ncbi:MAG: hypothetical protein COB09_15455 [Thalassobium sp.]|nr:MAG: hypothetical protein COB09_15455 [Thalassobium sp.]
MTEIRELLKTIELHDSTLDSLKINGDGSLELVIDIDEVWNKDLDKNIKGIVFSSVYEISDFKVDRMNIIGSIEIEDIDDYNTDFVTHNQDNLDSVVLVSIEFVAGGSLNIICSGTAGYLLCQA